MWINSVYQLIFAMQGKQVFYIQEPSRSDENDDRRWVVENVNLRGIWDLPMNYVDQDPIDNVDNNSTDVVLSNAYSNFTLWIDFS